MLIVAILYAVCAVRAFGFGRDTPSAKIFMHKLNVKNCVDDVFVNLLSTVG